MSGSFFLSYLGFHPCGEVKEVQELAFVFVVIEFVDFGREFFPELFRSLRRMGSSLFVQEPQDNPFGPECLTFGRRKAPCDGAGFMLKQLVFFQFIIDDEAHQADGSHQRHVLDVVVNDGIVDVFLRRSVVLVPEMYEGRVEEQFAFAYGVQPVPLVVERLPCSGSLAPYIP